MSTSKCLVLNIREAFQSGAGSFQGSVTSPAQSGNTSGVAGCCAPNKLFSSVESGWFAFTRTSGGIDWERDSTYLRHRSAPPLTSPLNLTKINQSDNKEHSVQQQPLSKEFVPDEMKPDSGQSEATK